jgi:hypothetical protein
LLDDALTRFRFQSAETRRAESGPPARGNPHPGGRGFRRGMRKLAPLLAGSDYVTFATTRGVRSWQTYSGPPGLLTLTVRRCHAAARASPADARWRHRAGQEASRCSARRESAWSSQSRWR